MLRYVSKLICLYSVFVVPHAWAADAMEPINLTQTAGGQVLPVGGHVPAGTTIELHATSQCPPHYVSSRELEIEILDVSLPFAPFRRGRTGHSYLYATCGGPFPPIPLKLISGAWKWRAREVISSSGGGGGGGGGEGGTGGSSSKVEYSDWVYFNGDDPAFTVDPTPIPDLLVSSVELTTASSDTASDLLTLELTTTLRNLGTQPTGSFSWGVWLSTDWIFDPGDQSIFTSAPITIGADSSTIVTGSVSVTPAPGAGLYYVFIEADSGNSVVEFDEANNFKLAPKTFIKGVDLAIEWMGLSPAAAGPGDTVTLDIKFSNRGIDAPPASQSPGRFRILASRDEFVDGTDVEVYSNTVTLSPGTQFDAPVSFVLPLNVPHGNVLWLLELDPANQVTEVFEDNNVAFTGLTFIEKPDLLPQSADLLDVTTGASTRLADVGGPARFAMQLYNDGDRAAGDFSIGVILSKNATLSLIDDDLIAKVPVSGIQPEVARTDDLVITLPSSLRGRPVEPGQYHLFLYVDIDNEVGERSEINNVTALGPVLLRRPSPDYLASHVAAPDHTSAGEVTSITWTFANVGTDDGFQVEYRCFASPNDTLSTADFPLTFIDTTGTTASARRLQLARGEWRTVTEYVVLPGNLPDGEYHLGCIIDPSDAAPELDESNNAASTLFPVQVAAQAFQILTRHLPHATLGTPYSIKLAVTGAQGPVEFAVKGEGSPPEGIRLEPDGTLTGAPTRLGEGRFLVSATSGESTFEVQLALKVLPPTTELTVTTAHLPPSSRTRWSRTRRSYRRRAASHRTSGASRMGCFLPASCSNQRRGSSLGGPTRSRAGPSSR